MARTRSYCCRLRGGVCAVLLLLLVSMALFHTTDAAPTANAAATPLAAPRPQEVPKSAFGQAFAEVVVESSLRVVGKSSNRAGRQGKKLELPQSTTASTTTTTTTRAQRVRRLTNQLYLVKER